MESFESVVNDYYKLKEELSYYSIPPTATQYARNAIFHGTVEMEKQFPQYWKNDPEEGGKTYMKPNLTAQLKRLV
jgi:hypothetical protein